MTSYLGCEEQGDRIHQGTIILSWEATEVVWKWAFQKPESNGQLDITRPGEIIPELQRDKRKDAGL